MEKYEASRVQFFFIFIAAIKPTNYTYLAPIKKKRAQ